MALFNTKEEKESFVLSSAIMLLVLLICFFFGLTSLDPPPENGIAINFGTSETGKGDVQPQEPVAAQAQQQTQPEPTPDDAILTQDDDSPVTVAPKKDTPKPVKPKEIKPVVEPPKKPSQQSNNALNNILNSNSTTGSNPASHGDDDGDGDKGDPKGSLYANSFYGNGTGNGTGSGNGTGWGLAGRKLAGNNKKVQDCNEEGKVVVKIWVNRQGNVFRAERSQGTTNTNPCLVNPALETAKTFKWQPDSNAPETQIGFVVVNFKLGE